MKEVEINIEYTLSNGKKIVMKERSSKYNEEELLAEVIGYNTGITWEIKDGKEITVVGIKKI
jgi:hypothetical protein